MKTKPFSFNILFVLLAQNNTTMGFCHLTSLQTHTNLTINITNLSAENQRRKDELNTNTYYNKK